MYLYCQCAICKLLCLTIQFPFQSDSSARKDNESASRSSADESKARLLPSIAVGFLLIKPERRLSYFPFLAKCIYLLSEDYRYGSLLRSGLEVRSVEKFDASGSSFVTLGVFSTHLIPKNAFITNYEGIHRYKTSLKTKADKSHAISLPNTMVVADGKEYASMFQRPDKAGQLSKPFTFPFPMHPESYPLSYEKRGIGYMMNHSPRSHANCSLKYIIPSSLDETKGYFPYPIFYAKIDIMPNTELTWCYNSNESKNFA